MLGYLGSAAAQVDAIQFGCAVPLSGPFAANGKYADMGMKLAIEKYGKVLGRAVAYTAIDTEGKPATAIRKVQDAIQQKGTRFFLGGFLSSEALAIGKDVPLVSTYLWRNRANGPSVDRKNAEGETLVHDHAAVCVRGRAFERGQGSVQGKRDRARRQQLPFAGRERIQRLSDQRHGGQA